MEAVGFAASLEQLAAAAKTAYCTLYMYYEDVRDAPKRSQELRHEMGAIGDQLNHLVALITSDSTSLNLSEALGTSISEFQIMLDEMNDRVKVSQTKGWRRLKWPFTKDENGRFLSRMERYKSIINLTLNIHTVYAHHPCFVDGRQIAEKIKVVIDDVEQEKRRNILKWLSIDNFKTKHEEFRSIRAENSGRWFIATKELREWVNGSESTTCLLCPGIRLIHL